MPLFFPVALTGVILLMIGTFKVARRRRGGVRLMLAGGVMLGLFLAVVHHWDATMRRVWRMHPTTAPRPSTTKTANAAVP